MPGDEDVPNKTDYYDFIHDTILGRSKSILVMGPIKIFNNRPAIDLEYLDQQKIIPKN
jgi:hypothetical protein